MAAGAASQVFVNPHGFLHEVVTVRWVVNVTVAGPPTTEFTWYPGYAWEVAWCGRCGAHLGWSFTAVEDVEPGAFWGLRRDAIVESRGG
jgi:cereblon